MPFAAMAIGLLIAPCGAVAQIKSVSLKVEGLACPFCVYGVEKKLKQLPAITDVSVDLKSGAVRLAVGRDQSFSVNQIRDAVREAGFTLRDVRMTAVGTVIEEKDRLVFVVNGTKQPILVFEESASTGGQPKMLSEPTETALRQFMREKASIEVSGLVHEHAEGPLGMDIEHYEATK
jgi:mercuric ion binding protein